MIYSYGCSFSTDYIVGKDDFWLNKVGLHLNSKFELWGTGGGEHHEAYHRLLFSMKDFKKGDLIIFQFSDHQRIGLRYKNYYLTLAGLKKNTVEETLENLEFLRNVVNIDKTDEEYLSLFDFARQWSSSQMFHSYWNVWNILSYLKNKIGIEFIILFLDHAWANVIPAAHYSNIPLFPVKGQLSTEYYSLEDGSQNVGLLPFFCKNGLTISQIDEHPNTDGHLAMSNILIKHIDNIECSTLNT